MLRIIVDNTGETFGDQTSIANLAEFSFAGEDSRELHIYRAEEIVRRDWRDELAEIEAEYATGITATFKDGSKLHVSAQADCCRPDEDGRFLRHCKWCGNG